MASARTASKGALISFFAPVFGAAAGAFWGPRYGASVPRRDLA